MNLTAAGIRQSSQWDRVSILLVLAVLSFSTESAFGQVSNEITAVDPNSAPS